MGARSAKLSSGCKDSPTNAFDEAPVASHQTLQLAAVALFATFTKSDRAKIIAASLALVVAVTELRG